MKKIIEFIKKIFARKPLTLNGCKDNIKEDYSKQKETFLSSIIVEEATDNISILQIRLEDGTIKEEELSNGQINKIKDLYCDQITNLVNSINNYKLKLN